MPKVYITETVLRDGHQSLIATRLRTEDMLPICPQLDKAGFWSLEVWGGATFDACLRFLKEDPWERLRTLRKALPNTRLQMLLRGQNLLGYRHYSDDVVRAFVDRAVANGIDVFRIFDALNDTRNLRTAIEAVKKHDKHAQGAISYTTSPVHGIEQFVSMAKEMESMGCDSIAIKDMAGLLTPSASTELVDALVSTIKLPIAIHSHATAGLASMCQLKGIEHGAVHIDTAISSFAGGTSHPPTESMVAALRGTTYDTKLDLALLQEIGFYFQGVRKKYHQYESEYTGIDTRVQINQVPGGMISNLSNQLREQGALDRMQEVLTEIPRVREDLGYPPLVTPTSQIVGSQAVLNVLTGARYKNITNEVKFYLQGRYGKTPGTVNSVVRHQAIANDEVIECRPADLLKPELNNLRNQIGGLAQNEEDVLTFAMFPEVGREFLEQRSKGELKPEPLQPLPSQNSQLCGAPTEFNITMHGETYHIKVTGSGHKPSQIRPFYITVDGQPEEVNVEILDELFAEITTATAKSNGSNSKRSRASKPGHVTVSIPSSVVDVLVKTGDEVEVGTPLLVTEAMKMESEIQSPVAGKIVAVHISKGDRVTPDETLIEIE
ncbi:MAG: sodium-extruding oxaloacetate decarboxylase subunit alpha [Thiohalomonadaceae bacterium]